MSKLVLVGLVAFALILVLVIFAGFLGALAFWGALEIGLGVIGAVLVFFAPGMAILLTGVYLMDRAERRFT